ncbi:MAG: Gmad2 immunoglobulin-like domain-containing protein, partial [Candidatus Buchananbacteria bacterium]
ASVYPSKDDLIKVTNILPNQKINSPITIKGEARGNWYFEASFPIRIINERGQVIGSATGIAQEDWMSENYVPFTSIIEFSAGTSTSGTIILQKDNPSGLSQYDNELEIPIQF